MALVFTSLAGENKTSRRGRRIIDNNDSRCPRCFSRLNPTKEDWERKMNPAIQEAAVVAGSGIGAMLGTVHALNIGLPRVISKGQKWLPLVVVGLPPLVMFSAASAALGGYVLPKFTQLSVTSYCAASSASHYVISLLTRRIEGGQSPRIQHKGFKEFLAWKSIDS